MPFINLFVVLPFLVFAGLFLLLLRARIFSRREAVLISGISCAVLAWAMVELLSLGHFLNFPAIVLSWCLPFFLISFMLLRSRFYLGPRIFLPFPVNAFDLAIVIGIFLIMAGTLVLSIGSPPNTWDALTYHMGRVAHWAQNHTVAPYPTHILRQIFSNPGFEYLVLHFYILGGGDGAVNIVQWCAMAGSLIAVTLIAQELGASKSGQILAAAVAVTIPMGIVESSSLQGDYMVAFFLSVAVYSLFRWRTNSSWVWTLLLGASSALAIISKSGIFFIGPVLILFLGIAVSKGFKKFWCQVAIVLFLILTINAGFVLRNLIAFHGRQALWSATQEAQSVLNESISPGILFINILRDAGSHMGTSSKRYNEGLEKGIASLAAKSGTDINDPRGTFGGHFEIEKPGYNENLTTAGIHLFLIAVSFVLVWFPGWGSTKLRYYLGGLLSMAFIFCLLVKWQPWVNRLELPLFVLAAAAVGAILDKIKFSYVKKAIVVFLFVFAIPYVINSYPRHLFGGKSIFKKTWEQRYFMMDMERYKNYASAADRLSTLGCRNIGLIIGGDDWEYPLWPLLKQRGMNDVRIEHIHIHNPSTNLEYPLGNFYPCAMVQISGPMVSVINLSNITSASKNHS